jgi:uncharacterized ferredoxin-like protein
MGMLWTMLLSTLSQHETQSETIVEAEASTTLNCECCSTRTASTPKEKDTDRKNDHGNLCGQSHEDEWY